MSIIWIGYTWVQCVQRFNCKIFYAIYFILKRCLFNYSIIVSISQSWGVRNITLADSGHVSFSNPVRQSLFVHEDAVQGKAKSKTAAERLRLIYPGLVSLNYLIVFHIIVFIFYVISLTEYCWPLYSYCNARSSGR